MRFLALLLMLLGLAQPVWSQELGLLWQAGLDGPLLEPSQQPASALLQEELQRLGFQLHLVSPALLPPGFIEMKLEEQVLWLGLEKSLERILWVRAPAGGGLDLTLYHAFSGAKLKQLSLAQSDQASLAAASFRLAGLQSQEHAEEFLKPSTTWRVGLGVGMLVAAASWHLNQQQAQALSQRLAQEDLSPEEQSALEEQREDWEQRQKKSQTQAQIGAGAFTLLSLGQLYLWWDAWGQDEPSRLAGGGLPSSLSLAWAWRW